MNSTEILPTRVTYCQEYSFETIAMILRENDQNESIKEEIKYIEQLNQQEDINNRRNIINRCINQEEKYKMIR